MYIHPPDSWSRTLENGNAGSIPSCSKSIHTHGFFPISFPQLSDPFYSRVLPCHKPIELLLRAVKVTLQTALVVLIQQSQSFCL